MIHNKNHMNTVKFLEEIKVLENRLRQKIGDESGKLGFPLLVKQLVGTEQIDKQILADFEKLWELRNKVCSTPTLNDDISDEAQVLLASLIGNSNLQ
jgi:hypothetical protein